jgi:hypothetical protein
MWDGGPRSPKKRFHIWFQINKRNGKDRSNFECSRKYTGSYVIPNLLVWTQYFVLSKTPLFPGSVARERLVYVGSAARLYFPKMGVLMSHPAGNSE